MYSNDSKGNNNRNVQLELDWIDNISDFRDDYDSMQNISLQSRKTKIKDRFVKKTVDLRQKLDSDNKKYYRLFPLAMKILKNNIIVIFFCFV